MTYRLLSRANSSKTNRHINTQ